MKTRNKVLLFIFGFLVAFASCNFLLNSYVEEKIDVVEITVEKLESEHFEEIDGGVK